MFVIAGLGNPDKKYEKTRHNVGFDVIDAMAKKYNVEFLYRDFRPGFREGQAKARELGLYMQKYCGCVFSEEERYAKQIKSDLEKMKKQ